MWRTRRHAQRLVGWLVADNTAGFFGNQMGGIAFFRSRHIVAIPVLFAVTLVSEIIDRTEHVTILLIKPASGWCVVRLKFTQMPFAANGCGITGFAQCLRESAFSVCSARIDVGIRLIGVNRCRLLRLEVDFFVWLHDNETVAPEVHLDRFTAAATKKCLEGDILLEFRHRVSGPGNRGVRVRGDGLIGRDAKCHRLEMRGDGDHACARELHIEQSAGHHAGDAVHHLDVPFNVFFQSQQVIAVHEDRFILQAVNRATSKNRSAIQR